MVRTGVDEQCVSWGCGLRSLPVISSLPLQETVVTLQRPWWAVATMAGSAPPRQLGSQEGSDRLRAWALGPRLSPHSKN